MYILCLQYQNRIISLLSRFTDNVAGTVLSVFANGIDYLKPTLFLHRGLFYFVMTANDTLITVLNAMNGDKLEDAYNAIEAYANTLSSSGKFYCTMKKMVKQRPMRFKLLDEMSGDIKKLVTQNHQNSENIFLNESTQNLLNELKIEWENADSFRYHNISIRNKILFHGITGNGKTTVARHIASMINLPFIEVNTDMLIDSHLGSSGSNIYKVFNQIKEPCILFLDEVDSVAKKRASTNDNSASNENDRIVNSLLVNLEKLGDKVILIAATNRLDILDTAFLRRFDVKFELLPPTNEEKLLFSNTMADYYKVPNMLNSESIQNYDSYSEIKNAFITYARKFILNTINPL